MFNDLKKFLLKGNIIDMATGFIVGGAFGKIVTSLVNDIIMPLIGLVLGRINLASLSYTLKGAEGDIPALTLKYGQFIQNIIDFIIIGVSIFFFIKIIVKVMAKLRKSEEATIPETPKQEQLLMEIRDLLKNKA